MNSTVFFAAAAGLAAASYTLFMRLASGGIHPALGATIVTGIAFIVSGSVTLWLKLSGQPVPFSLPSFWFLVLVGVSASGVDFFTLLAYSSGMKVTSSFVIGTTMTMLVLLFGFVFLKEPVTAMRLVGLALIFGGSFLLQREGI